MMPNKISLFIYIVFMILISIGSGADITNKHTILHNEYSRDITIDEHGLVVMSNTTLSDENMYNYFTGDEIYRDDHNNLFILRKIGNDYIALSENTTEESINLSRCIIYSNDYYNQSNLCARNESKKWNYLQENYSNWKYPNIMPYTPPSHVKIMTYYDINSYQFDPLVVRYWQDNNNLVKKYFSENFEENVDDDNITKYTIRRTLDGKEKMLLVGRTLDNIYTINYYTLYLK